MQTNCVKSVNNLVKKLAEKSCNKIVQKIAFFTNSTIINKFFRKSHTFAQPVSTYKKAAFNLLYADFYTVSTGPTITTKYIERNKGGVWK